MRIRYLQLKFTLQAESSFRPTRFIGNTIRGALGSALRSILCTERRSSCTDCPVRERCLYQYLFESSVGRLQDDGGSFPLVQKRVPHPFVLLPPIGVQRLDPGDVMHVGLTLFGRAVRLMPYLFLGFERVARRGIGRERVPFSLVSIFDGEGNVIFSMKDQRLGDYEARWWDSDESAGGLSGAKVKLVTPCRIKSRGRFANNIDFKLLITNILRRASSMAYFHENTEPDLDVDSIIRKADSIETSRNDTRWVELVRYSARQKSSMKFGGVVGEITYSGDGLKDFYSLLRFGEIAGVGKATSFGLGRIKVDFI